jgi:glutamate synthase (NADPH) small chain
MNDPKGFLNIEERKPARRPVEERVGDWKEVYIKPQPTDVSVQAERCMDCGVAFCHKGCPLGNLIPEWNDLVYNQKWQEAYKRLSLTNNFPEFTGTLCPAPCEPACVVAINDNPVTIKQIELSIIDRAFEEGWVVPIKPTHRSGKKVAVIGSGPAGLAAAQQLNRAGHLVTVFERADKIGGLLRYGIPEFKMEKWRLEKRLAVMDEEGIIFKPNSAIGTDVAADDIMSEFDSVVLTIGATRPRDLQVPGRDSKGIYFAMDFLTAQNRANNGEAIDPEISAKGKNVVIIGMGDTGSDCLGTALRQGAKSVTQLQIRPEPPKKRAENNPWPEWPDTFTVSSSQEEGGSRVFSVVTQGFAARNGRVRAIHATKGKLVADESGRKIVVPVVGTEYEIPADLVIFAMGFAGPETGGIVEQFGLRLTPSGNISTDENKMTSQIGVFAGGDAARGQSLIVWAIAEGRQVAERVDKFLSA